MPCRSKKWTPGDALPVISQAISKETTGNMRKKQDWAPPAEGASPKQVSSREGKAETLSARLSCISIKPSKVKGVPYLNPDPYCQFIGPKT